MVRIENTVDPLPDHTSTEKHSLNTPEEDSDLKRLKSRMRSKRARERKKMYIQGLESRIKELERENYKLRNLVKNSSSTKASKLVENLEEETKAPQTPTTTPFDTSCYPRFPLDQTFDFLIDNLFPASRFAHWKYLDDRYCNVQTKKPTYDLIKKFNKLKKFEKAEFIVEHEFNELDQLVAAFEPGKKQFDFIMDSMLKKELEIKKTIKEALHHLSMAKDKIFSANSEIQAHQYFLLSSEILTEEQISRAFSNCDIFTYNTASVADIFGVKKRKLKKSINMTKDPLMCKYAKKRQFKKKVFEFYYNSLTIS